MRFILLLIVAAIAVFAAVAAVQWSSKDMNGQKLLALPSWMTPPHYKTTSSETVAAKEEPAPAAREEATAKEPSARKTARDNDISPATVQVLVARDTIPMGTVIETSMIEAQAWPVDLLPDYYIALQPIPAEGSAAVEARNKEQTDKVVGKLVRSTFQAHEPIILSKLADPSDRNFLANELPSGMRAITIPVDYVSGIGGYIYPGDRVDVLFTHNVPQEVKSIKTDYKNTAFYRPAMAEVIVPNVRVLAINSRGASDKDGLTNVTIETSEEYAQRVRLAERLGILTLSLRPTKENNAAAANPTGVKDLSRPSQPQSAAAPAKKSGGSGVKIIRGEAPKPCSSNPCVIH